MKKYFSIKFIVILLLLTFGGVFYNQMHHMAHKIRASRSLDSLTGSYLAGYFAFKRQDTESAAKYFALSLKEDPQNKSLLEALYLSKLLSGQISDAIWLVKQHPENKLGQITRVIDAIKQAQYLDAIELIKMQDQEISKTDSAIYQVLMSWCYMALERTKEAVETMEKVSHLSLDYDMLTIVKLQHALLCDMAKDQSCSAKLYPEVVQTSPGNYVAYYLGGNFFERDKHGDQAASLYQKFNNQNPMRQLFKADLARLKNQQLKTMPMINSAKDAISLFVSHLAYVFLENRIYTYALIYGHIGLYINPESDDANVLLASYYKTNQDYAQGVLYFSKITNPNSYHYLVAQMNLIECLYKLNQKKQAQHLVAKLSQAANEFIEPQVVYADLLMQDKDYQAAITIYDEIINQAEQQNNSYWTLYYMRSICYNMLKDSDKAEQDLLKALSLEPNQYIVMNDLAYGWIVQNKNIDKALEMLSLALANTINNPQVMDSMGWALYMQGKYEVAVLYLEKASEVLPVDPTINEHLGDAYWRLGSKKAAQFEWQRAIDYSEAQEDKIKLEDKLANGL